MKKKYFIIMMTLVGTALAFSSCTDDSTEGFTRITYYPELSLEGDKTLCLDKGATFTDPGYTAILNGEDVTDQVEVNTNLNTGKSGVYTINYSIMNADGFSSSANRTIIVTDPNDAVEALYSTDPNCYRISGETRTVYGNSYGILVLNNGDGTYYCQDLLGGYYEQRAGYGSSYAMVGVFTVAEDGTITALSGDVAGWGDSMDYLEDGKFDAETGTISWKVGYAGMDFYVTMNK